MRVCCSANGLVAGSSSSESSPASNSAHGRTVEMASSHETVNVADWTPGHVAEFLQRIGLQRYAPLFASQHVNGRTLLQLDSARMKVSSETFSLLALCTQPRLRSAGTCGRFVRTIGTLAANRKSVSGSKHQGTPVNGLWPCWGERERGSRPAGLLLRGSGISPLGKC